VLQEFWVQIIFNVSHEHVTNNVALVCG